MTTYSYQALNASGKSQKGTVEAASSEEAIQRIKSQGYFPTSVQPQKEKSGGKKGKKGEEQDEGGKTDLLNLVGGGGGKKKKRGGGIAIGGVGAKQLTLFTRQLSTLQDAGLPLLRSLQILESQQKPGVLKNVLLSVTEEVEGGSSLSESMAKQPKAFDRLYVKMVNAGEIGGVLDLILQRLSEFMEKSQRLKRKIKGAMIYPIVVILIAVLILSAIMIFIIPKFEKIFADFEVELPALTLWLIDTSDWFVGNRPGQEIPGYAFVGVGIPAAFIFYKLIRKTPPGRAVTDWLFLRAPVFGNLLRKTVIARFTRTLGTLIGAGVPILEAVTITGQTSGNYIFERTLRKVHDSIQDGESFAGPLRESKTCDPIVVNMIDVGEETGDMDNMLMKIADNYDEEVDVAVESLVSLLEPLMVVILGGMVGTIVVAMFLPMVKMIEKLG